LFEYSAKNKQLNNNASYTADVERINIFISQRGHLDGRAVNARMRQFDSLFKPKRYQPVAYNWFHISVSRFLIYIALNWFYDIWWTKL